MQIKRAATNFFSYCLSIYLYTTIISAPIVLPVHCTPITLMSTISYPRLCIISNIHSNSDICTLLSYKDLDLLFINVT